MHQLFALYMSGAAVAVTVDACVMAAGAIGRFSILEKNLRSIGATQDLVTREVVYEGESGVFAAIFALGFAALLSWISVVWRLIQVPRTTWANLTAPAEVKLIRWRMRHALLSRIDVALNTVRMGEVLSGRAASEQDKEACAVQILCALSKRRRLRPDPRGRENVIFVEAVVGRHLEPSERLRVLRTLLESVRDAAELGHFQQEFDVEAEIVRERKQAADQINEVAEHVAEAFPAKIPLLDSYHLAEKLDEAAEGKVTHAEVLDYIDEMGKRLASGSQS